MTHPHNIPDLIRVERTSSGLRVLVDGEPFPFAVSAAEPISVDIARDEPPAIRLTLVASSVQVDNSWS